MDIYPVPGLANAAMNKAVSDLCWEKFVASMEIAHRLGLSSCVSTELVYSSVSCR